MTRLISLDPGKNSGIALGFYDAVTPYRLEQRWQVHGGVLGFIDWMDEGHWHPDYEVVSERFDLADNDFKADLTPVQIEGLIIAEARRLHQFVAWQPRTDKSRLTGYPKEAVTQAQRQRVRFDFLDRFGMFAKGANNDDSNDAICHAMVYLKQRRHMPSLRAYWGPKSTARLAG